MAPGVSAIQPATVGMMGSWTPLARRDEGVDLPISNAVLRFVKIHDVLRERHRLHVPDNDGEAVGRLARLDADRAAGGPPPTPALRSGRRQTTPYRETYGIIFKELERG